MVANEPEHPQTPIPRAFSTRWKSKSRADSLSLEGRSKPERLAANICLRPKIYLNLSPASNLRISNNLIDWVLARVILKKLLPSPIPTAISTRKPKTLWTPISRTKFCSCFSNNSQKTRKSRIRWQSNSRFRESNRSRWNRWVRRWGSRIRGWMLWLIWCGMSFRMRSQSCKIRRWIRLAYRTMLLLIPPL